MVLPDVLVVPDMLGTVALLPAHLNISEIELRI